MMETINMLTTILSVALGAGWGINLLYFRHEKRKRGAEVKIAELSVDAKEDEIRDSRLIRAYETIVKLQGIVDTERERWVSVSTELSGVKEILFNEKEARKAAERARKEAEHDKCTVSCCDSRIPPRAKTK